VSFDPWSAPLAALAIVALAAWWVHGLRKRFAGWGWWRPVAFTFGIALICVATLSPLDEASGDGLVSAHIGQHLILGDLAAVPLLFGMPPRTRRWLGGLLARLSGRRGLLGTLISRAISPFGALMLWAAATYFWFVPEIHRAATPPGPAHLLEQFSFLLFGFLIWILVFDPRPAQPGARAMRYGGLPWWARHI
jgi:putative membrane protein